METIIYNLDKVISIRLQDKTPSRYYRYKPAHKILFGLFNVGECIEEITFGKQYNVETFLNENDSHILYNNVLYTKPRVTITLDNNDHTTKYFDSYQEAQMYANSITIKTPLTINTY